MSGAMNSTSTFTEGCHYIYHALLSSLSIGSYCPPSDASAHVSDYS